MAAAIAVDAGLMEIQLWEGAVLRCAGTVPQRATHDFGVVKAEWTPDSQYFVFSLTSSGGHQAWRAPTQFLSRKDGTVRALDDYFLAGISNGDFRLIAPNTVETEVWEDKSVPVSIKLDALPPLRSWRKSKPFS